MQEFVFLHLREARGHAAAFPPAIAPGIRAGLPPEAAGSTGLINVLGNWSDHVESLPGGESAAQEKIERGSVGEFQDFDVQEVDRMAFRLERDCAATDR